MGTQYGISPEELAWRRKQHHVTGSAHLPKLEPEPESALTREQMAEVNRARVDALKRQGRLPSFDQVKHDVLDLLDTLDEDT
jgi:hypothetical protein